MEQRQFQRVRFVARTEVERGDTVQEATLVDISLKGALVRIDAAVSFKTGEQCRLATHLNLSPIVLSFDCEVIHVHEDVVGVRFTRVDIQSMIHLRRLIELNAADPDHIRHELYSLIH